MEKKTEAEGRKQLEAFALRHWGKEEKLWERKPEPQSLLPPSVGRKEMSCVKEGMRFWTYQSISKFQIVPCL